MSIIENPFGEEEKLSAETPRQRKKRIGWEIFDDASADFASVGLDLEKNHVVLLRVAIVKRRRYTGASQEKKG